MPEQWMSVSAAAAAMNVHTRTVERRLAAGKIESRRADDGQVQVLVDVPEAAPDSAAVSAHALDTVRDLADRQVDIAAGSASALVRIAQEQTLRAETQLALARQDAGRYRRETQMAVGLVAVMLLLVIVAVGWCTHAITASRADSRLSGERAADAVQSSWTARSERDALRARLDDAETARAKADGELTAYRTELAAYVEQTKPRAPATQPTNLVSRLTQAFAGD